MTVNCATTMTITLQSIDRVKHCVKSKLSLSLAHAEVDVANVPLSLETSPADNDPQMSCIPLRLAIMSTVTYDMFVPLQN